MLSLSHIYPASTGENLQSYIVTCIRKEVCAKNLNYLQHFRLSGAQLSLVHPYHPIPDCLGVTMPRLAKEAKRKAYGYVIFFIAIHSTYRHVSLHSLLISSFSCFECLGDNVWPLL